MKSISNLFEKNNLTAHHTSFIHFIWNENGNRKFFIIGLAVAVLQFTVFKSCYPFADFFSDSYSYIFGAYARLNINIWPIGYSKFLALLHTVTSSDTITVAIQYFLLFAACIYLFFSVLYWFNLSINGRNLLFAGLFFNPLSLYVCNYINSDGLFASVSIFWVTELIWILRKPRWFHLVSQAILVFLAFTIRNNAYYYPMISLLAFSLCPRSWWYRVTGGLLGLVVIFSFIQFTREAAFRLTGIRQYSLFTGWQLANNVLYMRGNIKIDSTVLPNDQVRQLDNIANRFYRRVAKGFDEELDDYVANYFIREPRSPLKVYFNMHYPSNDELQIVRDWAKASVVYQQYGQYLINHYPVEYARYFVWRNVKAYFLPPLEKLDMYNLGSNQVMPIAQKWFHYRSDKVSAVSMNLQGSLLFLFPVIFLLFNCYMLFEMARWLWFKKIRRNWDRCVIVLTGFALMNVGFTVVTSMNVMRYQVVPFIVLLLLSIVAYEKNGWLSPAKIASKEHVDYTAPDVQEKLQPEVSGI